MELSLLVKLLFKNFWIFVVLSLVTLSFAVYQNTTETPLFRSNMDLFVSTPISAIDVSMLATGSNFGTQRVKSYAQIINSSFTMKETIRRLNLNESVPSLARRVSAVAPLDTVLITVSVVDKSPTKACAIARTIGEVFTQQVDKLEVSSNSTGSPISVNVVKDATVPTQPFSPKKSLNLLIALCISIVLSFLIAFFRFIRDDRVKNESDLEGIQLIGVFDFYRGGSKEIILNPENMYSHRAETFRQIRSGLFADIIQSNREFPIGIGVCSALPGEGKSTTALDLAITCARSGMRILLIETDLRKPSLTKLIESGFENLRSPNSLRQKGMINYLQTEELVVEQTSIETLSLLLCEKILENPTELLSDKKIENLISKSKGNYDLILFDTPPILPISDSSSILRACSYNIFVVHAGKTRISEFHRAVELTKNYRGAVWGVIINKVPKQRFFVEYGYGYGYGYTLRKNFNYKYYSYRSDAHYASYLPQEKSIKGNLGNEILREKSKNIKEIDFQNQKKQILTNLIQDIKSHKFSSILSSKSRLHAIKPKIVNTLEPEFEEGTLEEMDLLKKYKIDLSGISEKSPSKKSPSKKSSSKKSPSKKSPSKKSPSKKSPSKKSPSKKSPSKK